jgi:hypothetical protein
MPRLRHLFDESLDRSAGSRGDPVFRRSAASLHLAGPGRSLIFHWLDGLQPDCDLSLTPVRDLV